MFQIAYYFRYKFGNKIRNDLISDYNSDETWLCPELYCIPRRRVCDGYIGRLSCVDEAGTHTVLYSELIVEELAEIYSPGTKINP